MENVKIGNHDNDSVFRTPVLAVPRSGKTEVFYYVAVIIEFTRFLGKHP